MYAQCTLQCISRGYHYWHWHWLEGSIISVSCLYLVGTNCCWDFLCGLPQMKKQSWMKLGSDHRDGPIRFQNLSNQWIRSTREDRAIRKGDMTWLGEWVSLLVRWALTVSWLSHYKTLTRHLQMDMSKALSFYLRPFYFLLSEHIFFCEKGFLVVKKKKRYDLERSFISC